MASKTTYSSIRRSAGYGIHRHQDEFGLWFDGYVATPNGHVNVYSQTGHTTLHFIHAGVWYTRTFDRRYQPRALVTLADKFAKEICNAGD